MNFYVIISLVWFLMTVAVIAVIEYCTHSKRSEEWREMYDDN